MYALLQGTITTSYAPNVWFLFHNKKQLLGRIIGTLNVPRHFVRLLLTTSQIELSQNITGVI